MRDQATIHIGNIEHRLQQRASLNLISTRSVSRETNAVEITPLRRGQVDHASVSTSAIQVHRKTPSSPGNSESAARAPCTRHHMPTESQRKSLNIPG